MSVSSSRSARLRGLLRQSRDGSLMKSREELKLKLLNKLVAAYGGHCEGDAEHADFRKTVKTEVDALDRRCSRARITEKDLRELEDAVRDMSTQGKNFQRSKKQSLRAVNDSGIAKNNNQSSVEALPRDNYQVFVEADRVQHERDQKAYAAALLAKQRETRRVLDEQMEELRARKQREKEELMEFAREQREQVRRDEEYLREKQRQERERIEKDKLLRFEQIRLAKERLKRREAFKRREAEKETEKCKRELQKEKELALAKQEQQRQYMLKVERENEVRKKENEARKREIWEEDIRRAREYEAKLAADEAARAKALADLQARSKLNQRRYEIATENAREAERQLEGRIAEFHRKKMEKEQRELDAVKAKKKEDLKRMKATLDDQMKQRQVEKQKEKEELDRFSEKFRQLAEQAATEEKAKQALLRQQARAHQDFVRGQIEEQKRKKAELDSSTLVTDREQKINAKTFQRIHSDNELVLTIRKNLREDRHKLIAAKKEARKHKVRIRPDYYT